MLRLEAELVVGPLRIYPPPQIVDKYPAGHSRKASHVPGRAFASTSRSSSVQVYTLRRGRLCFWSNCFLGRVASVVTFLAETGRFVGSFFQLRLDMRTSEETYVTTNIIHSHSLKLTMLTYST